MAIERRWETAPPWKTRPNSEAVISCGTLPSVRQDLRRPPGHLIDPMRWPLSRGRLKPYRRGRPFVRLSGVQSVSLIESAEIMAALNRRCDENVLERLRQVCGFCPVTH